jgi:cell division septal protein FtsQ
MVGPIVGGLFVREGNRRRERWKKWRIFAAVVHVIWVFVALLLGVGYLFSPGNSW